MPEPAYADNEIKRDVGARDNDKLNAKKRKKKTLKILYEISVTKLKNINIACLYYVWLSGARTDIMCSRNVILFPIIYTTIPLFTNGFFTKYMYCDEIKFINVSFSTLLTNLCEKIDFDSWPPEGPFSPDGSHLYLYLYNKCNKNVTLALMSYFQKKGLHHVYICLI